MPEKSVTQPPVLVQNPSFPDSYEQVPADKAKEWTDVGWKRVSRDDEGAVRAKHPELNG